MNVGQILLFRIDGELRKGKVKKVNSDDVDIELADGKIISKYYWEVRKVKRDEEEKFKNIP